MRNFLVVHKFVTALACVAAFSFVAPEARAVDLKDLAATCMNLISPNKVYRGSDAALAGQWIILSGQMPELAQVVRADANNLSIRRMNFETMTTEMVTIARPTFLYLSNDAALTRYERDLGLATQAALVRNQALIGKVVQIGGVIGTAKIIGAWSNELEVEYVNAQSMRVSQQRIKRPARLEFLTDVRFDDLAENARRVTDVTALRPGNYVFWTPNAVVTNDGVIQYDHPVSVPIRNSLLSELREQGFTHARVSEVDLIKGTFTLVSRKWAIVLPLRKELLKRSQFKLSPVGTLDALNTSEHNGFRQFRSAFLSGRLQRGTAVLVFSNVGGDPLRAPKEIDYSFMRCRVELVGPNFILVSADGAQYKIEGAHSLAHVSTRSSTLAEDAEVLVSRHEATMRHAAPSAGVFPPNAMKQMPFLARFDVIKRELTEIGLQPTQIDHYAQQILNPRKPYFWRGGGDPRAEWKSIMVNLHATKLTALSNETQEFAAEVYARGSAFARDFRGYSEKR